MALQEVLNDLIPSSGRVRFTSYDGATLGPPDAPTRVVIRRPEALQRMVTALGGEIGLARAYVAGDVDIEGPMWPLLDLQADMTEVALRPQHIITLARELGVQHLRPLPPPPEEVRLTGRRHSRERDAQAVAAHYDVSNEFYRVFLGPSMTYSCAVFRSPDDSLEDAQAQKYELICRKLDLKPGMRLLDVGCGWGGMVMHAAEHHGVEAVGITVAQRQVKWAEEIIAERRLSDRVEVRYCDYRDVGDGPYDAISSIGMFEHVGAARLGEYFGRLHGLLKPDGRLLNHGIARPPGHRARLAPRGFVDRFVFPDGELLEIGRTVSALHEAGLEPRHLESLREHYALTLRRWVDGLETNWDEAVAEVGEGRARVWRLYMAGAAWHFEHQRTQIYQVLGVKPGGSGMSGMPLRPRFE